MTLVGACGLGPAPQGSSPTPAQPERTTSVSPSTRSSTSPAPSASPGDIARQAAEDAFGDQLGALDPADRETVLGEFVSAIGARLEGMSRPAAQAELLRMVSIGTFRLDDATLVRRLELETKEMLGIDVALCAALARGELEVATPSSGTAGLSAPLTPAERLENARITVAAVRAEVARQREPRQITKPETTAIVGAIAKLASPQEATRIHDLATQAAAGHPLSDDDACWLMRVPYRALDRLGEADRLLLSRYVLGAMTG
jgi:hypothetical protein